MREWMRAVAALVVVIGTIAARNGARAVNVTVVIGGRAALTDVQGNYRVDGVAAGRQVLQVVQGRRVLAETPVYIDARRPTVVQNVTLP